MGVHLKKIESVLHVFRNPLHPIPNITTCPSSPGAREPISVVIRFDCLRKKEAMMQKANVSHGQTKVEKMVRRRELPSIRRLRS
jgi:hypothetical protein